MKTDGSSRGKVRAVSILFMGLAHLLYFRQYLKGLLFAAAEIVMLALSPFFVRKLRDLITLGSPQPELPVKLRDNSVFMLIDGVMVCAVLAVFFALYVLSVKSALASYETFCVLKKHPGKQAGRRISGNSFPVFGLAPTVLLVLFFVVVPLVFSACAAFTNYASPNHIPPNNTVDWVGFENFSDLFGGEAAWTSALGRVALWTLIWGLSATLTCYFGGLFLAVLLQESRLRIAPVFRGIFILPYAVPSVVSVLVWKNLLNGSFGIVNRTLMELGWISAPIPWLSDTLLAKFMCIFVNLWAGFPYFMLLTLGTMTAISPDVYEAARIDGANRAQVFRKITLPLVMYQTTPLMIMSFTHNINNFGAIFFLTGGMPKVSDSTITAAGGTDILVTWIYQLTVNLLKYNYAAVVAVLLFLVIAPFAILNFRRTKSYREGEL